MSDKGPQNFKVPGPNFSHCRNVVDCVVCQVVRKLQMTERELERMEERAETAELYVFSIDWFIDWLIEERVQALYIFSYSSWIYWSTDWLKLLNWTAIYWLFIPL